MAATEKDYFTDPARCEPEEIDQTAWGENIIQIGGSWYSKREMLHTRCNTCEAHTDQVFYQNEDDETFICLCSCWTDSIRDTDPRAVTQKRS